MALQALPVLNPEFLARLIGETDDAVHPCRIADML